MKLGQGLKTAAKFALAAALIAYLIQRGHLDLKLFVGLLRADYLVIGLGLVGLTVWLQAWRWQQLLQSRNFPTSLVESLKLFLIGVFFNYALPGSTGGDLVKAYYLAQDHRQRRVDAVLTVVIDRLLGLYVMIAVALVSILFNWQVITANRQLTSMAMATGALFVVMTSFWVAAFSGRVSRALNVSGWLTRLPFGARLTQIYVSAQGFGCNKLVLLKALILSGLAQGLSILFMVLVGAALGETNMPLGAYLFAVPIGLIIASVPIAPAGLGVGQAAFLVLFQLYSGQSSQLGQTAITAFQMALLLWGLLGAVFYLQRGRPLPSAESLETV